MFLFKLVRIEVIAVSDQKRTFLRCTTITSFFIQVFLKERKCFVDTVLIIKSVNHDSVICVIFIYHTYYTSFMMTMNGTKHV